MERGRTDNYNKTYNKEGRKGIKIKLYLLFDRNYNIREEIDMEVNDQRIVKRLTKTTHFLSRMRADEFENKTTQIDNKYFNMFIICETKS